MTRDEWTVRPQSAVAEDRSTYRAGGKRRAEAWFKSGLQFRVSEERGTGILPV